VAKLGFADIGSYREGVFNIKPIARSMSAVYVWMLEENGFISPVRVGETRQVGSRFSSYNGWLRGRQWPGERRNAREQEKARLTRLRLGRSATVVAIPVSSKELGLAVERILLDIWEPALDLNFELLSSWGRARLQVSVVARVQT
jgi:hypothetical protein